MKKISKIFPVMMMEAEIDNYNSINARLKTEIKSLFDKINEKRVLSHKWDDFLITENTHELGYTSFNSKDYHDLTKISEFDFFYNHISKLITEFFTQLDYMQDWNFTNSWASVYPRGAYIPLHDHKPVQWSGVYYVNAPENCGNIRFIDPKEYALQNEPEGMTGRGFWKHVIVPSSGLMLMFPGYLKHESLPSESDEDRIIISFNINCS
jgi:uncharacterized protein (TIGR02466 family)